MKTLRQLFIITALLLCSSPLRAQVPQLISYQGRVTAGGTNFNGAGLFKFALVRGGGAPSLWSNDGTSVDGSEPTASVSIAVANGVFTVLLGDATLPNMTVIPASVFAATTDVRLRVWFNDGVSGFQQLSPDQRIVAVGYAMMSADIADGAITASKLADGAVTQNKLANGAVTSGKIADDAIGAIQIAVGAVNSSDIANGSILGEDLADGLITAAKLAPGSVTGVHLVPTNSLGTSNGASGRLDIYRTLANTAGISLIGAGSQISTYGADGLEQIRLWGPGWGELLLHDNATNNATTAQLLAHESNILFGQVPGGALRLTQGTTNRVYIKAGSSGGQMSLYQIDGQTGVFLDGDDGGAGSISVRSTNGSTRVLIDGLSTSGGGEVAVNDSDGTECVQLVATSVGGSITLRDETGLSTAFLGSSSVGGYMYLYDNNGQIAVYLDGDNAGAGYVSVRNTNALNRVVLDGQSVGGGGEISVYDATGTETVEILGAESSAAGGQILMRNAAGTTTIQLDSDASGVACGYLALYRSNGVANIILNSEDGTVQGQVIEITGGSDFSEKFDIRDDLVEPGMIVSIDPQNPGRLALCTSAHDKKVAGIVSGAGGVKPGMLMGQRGSVADGKHPVALTGRVYCWVDADANGAVEPGDMITTSATPGHGMKVTDHLHATGSIIGKAMTPLERGKGLVLVLVNLQ